MDKKGERGKRSSPQSTSRRAYGLFSSIINLSSSSSGVRSGSPQNSLANSPSTNSKPLDVSVKKKKKSGNQSPSSCSSISSSGGGGGSSGGGMQHAPLPIGPGPRTFSILTALNELAISDQESHLAIPRPRSLSPSSASKGNQKHPNPGSSISSGNSTSTSSSTGTFQHSLRQAIKPGGKLGRLPTNRDGTHISLQKGREIEKVPNNNEKRKSKERTPEWIWKIFQLAKHGRLNELQQSLKGLDPTLIRHLADAKGSTLLHCAARGGHLSTLQWLLSILGPHTEAALNDHNRAGRTVILTALKGGRLECFQWLVLNTNTGDIALVPSDGERSLLHYAASYGDSIAVRWLSQLLHERGVHVDLRDASGLTALHMSAKSGYILVCHELILAGADPISKTESGWRPVDLAIRQRRMECVNYLVMAETAASIGSDLHLLLKEFQTLRQETDSLRSHFRELLRVGKWLVKERTNLIKNFPSMGSKSPSEASILLGGTSNGTRFSELEHKLVQAEQAWKCLNVVNQIAEHKELSENCTSYHFEKSLADAQSRCDKNLSLSAPSSSDEESCLSAASSTSSDDDDNVRDHPIYPQRKIPSPSEQYFHHRQRYPHHHSSKMERSTTAPWLLPPNDGLLAQLSPFVSQLDLLGNAPSAPALPPVPPPSNQPSLCPDEMNPESPNPVDCSGGDQSLVSSNRTFLGTSHQPKNTSNVEATVLEVIEPTSSTIKGAYFTPDLIREHKCGSTAESEWLETQGEGRLDETIYSEIKGSSYSSSTSIKSSSTPIGELPPPVFQQKQKKHQFPLPKKCQKQRISCTSSTYSDTGHNNSTQLASISSSTIQFLGQDNAASEGNSSNGDSFSSELLNPDSNEQVLLTNVVAGPSSSRMRSHTSRLTVLPIMLDSSPKLTFPILASVEFSPEQLDCTGSQEEISCGPSGSVPPDSVSTSNTPVMRRSYSSVSRNSSTVLFPLQKESWICPEFSSSMTTESGLTGRLSPSPSEASRTESALAPPPSNASLASQNSEASKTESAQGGSANVDREYREDGGKTHLENEYSVEERTEDEDKSETTARINSQKNPGERNRHDERKDDEDDESGKITSLVSMPPQNIQAIPCIMRPLVSSGIHKATIQRVTKSGRGQSKPWYEFEGSDDEGSLLRKASKSRSSRSSKLSTSSLSNSESQNESEETSDEHECDTSSCPRHNCTDFV